VLAGVIAALVGQGLEPLDAAALGAFVHGRAGERRGSVGVASDVAAALPQVLRELRASPGDEHADPVLHRFP
jgi:NAD(P)H-hydrate epimerase